MIHDTGHMLVSTSNKKKSGGQVQPTTVTTEHMAK